MSIPSLCTAALAAFLVLPCVAQERSPHEQISGSDWAGIRQAYEAGRHRVVAVDGEHRAHNPAQQWSTQFDGRGFTTTPDGGGWSWGLELARYGWGDGARAVAQPPAVRAEGGRIEYAWDETLTEWYVNDRRGLEHGYTVHARPTGARGALEIVLSVRGELVPAISADGRDVRFGEALTYAGLSVFDADGETLTARWTGADGALRLSVDDEHARYPLTIDPIAQQAYLKASNTDAGDGFGVAVAVSGDTAVVGANGESSNATGVNGDQSDDSADASGAAYVFVRSGSVWTQQAYLKASNTDAEDEFGAAVAISGDTIVVGAWREASNASGVNGNQTDNSAQEAGAAYVFVRSGTTWTQQAYLKSSSTDGFDEFGVSVAASGDTVVVGGHFEDSGATGINGNPNDNSVQDSGAAHVFVRSGTTWTQQAYLKASNTGADDQFGYSVSISGDTVLVGAIGEHSSATGVGGDQSDNGAPFSGAAYVFVRSGTTWSQQAYLKASNTGAADSFGWSVSIADDTAVVGAWEEDSNATGVDGDGSNNAASKAGAAYVFGRSGTAWSQQAYLKASNTNADDQFGYVVSVSGDTVVVGAWKEDSSAVGIDGDQRDKPPSRPALCTLSIVVGVSGGSGPT